MSKLPNEYLKHILDECNYILKTSSRLQEKQFMRDKTLQRAFSRSLEIIGEASKKVPKPVRALDTSIEWKFIAEMRDRLIHGYFGVDYEIVWDVVVNENPPLRVKIIKLLKRIK